MRKFISILLIVFVILGLVACGETAKNENNDESMVAEDISAGEEESNQTLLEEAINVEEDDIIVQESVPDSAGKNVLVVYFSVTGNTKNVAEKIAAVANADIYEIKPVEEYTDSDINYGDSESRTSKEQNDSSVRPEIKSEAILLDGYDTIYIGYPIWWGEEPRIMDTFVENNDFGDITLIPFCTSGSSGIGNSGKNLAANAASGNWLDGKRFDSNVSENEISDWISGLQ